MLICLVTLEGGWSWLYEQLAPELGLPPPPTHTHTHQALCAALTWLDSRPLQLLRLGLSSAGRLCQCWSLYCYRYCWAGQAQLLACGSCGRCCFSWTD
jgi:hypothetical protein